MRFTTAEIAEVTGGELVGDDVEVEGARHDSREVTGGELFVPVRGERDGHDFILAAVEAGAAAYLTARPPQETAAPAVVVDDPLAALADLGRVARRRLPGAVVGITGSVGKTSTKDLTAAVLGRRFVTAASVRSFNNEIGVPLTLVNAPDGAEAAVVEMGARGKGHIAGLCEIAAPTIAVVTTVELVHTELFGHIDQVAEAKRELVELLPAHGTAVLNVANPRVAAMAAHTTARVLTFGREDAELCAEAVTLDDELRPSFVLRSPWGTVEVRLAVRGEHNVMNALAAAGVGLAAGVELDAIVAGLHDAALSPWRMELLRSPSGLRIINDAYNAGPASMEAALRSLARLVADRRVAVLGIMAELGDHAEAAHDEIADIAAELGIDVVAVDAPYAGAGVHQVADLDEAYRCLEAMGALRAGTALLVKGSRVAGLERLAARLAEHGASAPPS